MTDFDVIATINSHLLDENTLREFAAHGATILRVNGAHVQPHELRRYAGEVRKYLGNDIRLLVDLPGNKVRTGVLGQPIHLRADASFDLYAEQVSYPRFLNILKCGDIILANDGLLKFEVQDIASDKAVLKSYSDGLLESNKGFHLQNGSLELPFFFPKDRELIEEAIGNRFDLIGLSFVRNGEDIRFAKEVIGDRRIGLIAKVETKSALANLDSVIAEADHFLLDRGDLSSDIGIEKIHYYQKHVVGKVKQQGKKIFLATHFLHSMTMRKTPLISEICGLSDVLEMGVDGIQLSEETAEGKFPIEALKTVQDVRAFVNGRRGRLRFGRHCVIWLTGRSGSGKTTLGERLKKEILSAGHTCAMIDGDEFRAFWGDDVGYGREERIRNQRNIIFTAHQASKLYDVVLVASLSPYRAIRSLARQKIDNFHEVFVECSNEVCAQRDPNGHYQNKSLKERQEFMNMAADYEEPEVPDLVVNTESSDLADSLQQLRRFLFV